MGPFAKTVAATRVCEALGTARDPAGRRREVAIEGIYRSAINLRTDDGDLVTIAVDGVGGLPHGILVRGVVDFRVLGIRAGPHDGIGNGAVGLGNAFSVDLTSAASWSARLPRLDPGPWRQHRAAVRALAAAHHAGTGLAHVPGGRPGLRALGVAIAREDHIAAVEAARQLIGLGPGLTPSGDDALAGVEAALHVAGHRLAGFLHAALADIDQRTTTVSAAMLRHAARGDAPERLHRLMSTVLAPSPAGLADAVRATVEWGATSGCDTLAGALVALDAVTVAADGRRAA